MKVGVCEAPELKAQGEKLQLAFADALWGYMVEDMMLRIYGSAYREHLWLQSRNILGVEAYRERSEKAIHFLYQPSGKHIAEDRLCPGQKLSAALCEQMVREIFMADNERGIDWIAEVSQENQGCRIALTGRYREMQVPLCILLHSIEGGNNRPIRQETRLPVTGDKPLSYPAYAPENQLSRDLFEIINKLELIGDMGCYDRVYRLLRSESLSGRYVLEELTAQTADCPNVRSEQRLKQLGSYEQYTYMRRRWEKYVRNRRVDPVAWEALIQLLLCFLTPVWHSLCCNEIFFDDWMPELGRFLG